MPPGLRDILEKSKKKKKKVIKSFAFCSIFLDLCGLRCAALKDLFILLNKPARQTGVSWRSINLPGTTYVVFAVYTLSAVIVNKWAFGIFVVVTG